MKTTCPIATISYNSQDFLLSRLLELERNHKISSWFFIYHFAEEDEKKDHYHVWIKPNGKIDTMDLQDFFTEYNPDDPEHPFKCIDFVSSKIDFAILYYSHWRPYLMFIGQSRRFHYDWTQFVVSDPDWFDCERYKAMHFSAFAEKNRMLCAINDNERCLSELISTGVVPLNLASQVYAYSNLLDNDRVERGKRKTHTPKYGDNGIDVTPDGLVGGGGVKLN